MISRYISSFIGSFDNLRGDGRGKILIALACGWGLTIGGRMIYPVLLPHLRTAYDLDLAAAGTLLTLLFVAYALAQLPGGVLADRIGERTTLAASLLLAAGSLLLVIFASSRLVLFATTAVFGVAVGLFAIPRFTATATIYPDNYGTAIGITNSSAELGQALLPAIAGVVAFAVGWQFGFGFTIPLFVLIALALWLTVPERPPDETSSVDTLSVGTARYVLAELRNPPVILGTVILVFGMSIWQALTGFYPTYLVEVKGISTVAASAIFGLYFVLSAIIHPISGAVYDRWNIRYTFGIVGVSVLGFGMLPIVDGVPALVGVTILLGAFLGFVTATESYLISALPADMEGTGFGVLRTISFTVGAMSPVIFGAVADRGYFDEVFLVLGGLVVVMVLVGIRLPKD